MNKRQKEVIQHNLDNEKAVLKQLEKQYQAALDDINIKIKILQSDELTQSRIYRIEHQQALKGQVEAILDKLHSDEYDSINKYLNDSYTDAFVGTMYDLHGQGVPLITPIDQKAAVKAVMTDSQINEGLYKHLGVDTKNLKRAIQNEITRGIATGMPYSEIARNISNTTKAPLARANTIVRTEAHRIQQASTHDAQVKAKDKGADIVKQWDASLDGATRPTHRQLDGQIREIDEPFKANGKSAMYPGDFGDPAEDCNCRCVTLQRAKWALDEAELQTLKDRAEFFELDKSKDFEDFKKKYLKAAESVEHIEKFTPASTIEKAKEFATDTLGLQQTTAYALGLNVDVANGLNEAIYKMTDTFGNLTEAGYLENVLFYTKKTNAYAAYSEKLRSVFLNPVAKQKSAIKKMAADAMEQFEPGAWSTGNAFHTVYHELGHAVQHMVLDNDTEKRKKIEVLYKKTFSDILGAETAWTADQTAARPLAAKAKEANFSYYGLMSSGEFVAEAIAQYFLADKPSDIAKTVVKILAGGK